MAITVFKEQIERGGDVAAERKGPLTEIPRRKYRRRFTVQTNDVNDGPKAIRSHVDCPKLGNSYISGPAGSETDSLATCVNVKVFATDTPFAWEAEAEYDTARLVDAALDNPLNAPAELSWDFQTYERVIVRDILGAAIVNSSKEAFDPPITVEDSRPILTVVRNEASFSAAFALNYQNAVNSDTFAGAAARFARINKINGVRQRELGLTYYKVTYEVEFRREGWDRMILDQGFRGIDKKLFRDPVDFSPLSNPTLLNGRGARLTDATTTHPVALTASDTAVGLASLATFPPFSPAPPHPGRFEIKIDNEIMHVTGNPAGTTVTVVRGYAGTTAASHLAGGTVTLEPYYLAFFPYKVLAFAPLNLPVV